MEALKNRERQILEYMKDELRLKGYPPTVREICTALDIKSTSTAHSDLARLARKGYIKKDPSKPRALMLTGMYGEETADAERLGAGKTAESGSASADRIDVVDVPVVGRIAAGSPVLAQENIEDSIPVPARFMPSGTSFMLTVRGDSMVEAGICDGDYILVRQQETADNGDIVVAMVDGFESEATVKTFYRENGHIRLQPENASMSPILLNDVRILGLVKGVFRYLS
ncbi:MAG: transcriptional repressor LexA [Clostridiales Family XIII bacterium]|jgi:repressor LexA|nr:transcriptional repressor LexA [Clostridiales Family XIII bacterium]